ncbi:hypothetical protein VHEMI08098 [[Torrubiella] hemipterigena]|uniref:Uncharacterized protein n=1 Tax=[Torrubiella] hemipterigena TaxID=1531966 RepID=A0A0A1TMK5_9HYPO|nr:hypothetical protein VHEMI08098 [[Torrubiella] hemipterigena]
MCKATAITEQCSQCNEKVIVTLVSQPYDQSECRPETDTRHCPNGSTIVDDEGNNPTNWKLKVLVQTKSNYNQCGHLGHVPFNHGKDHLNAVRHSAWADVCKSIGWELRTYQAPDEVRH